MDVINKTQVRVFVFSGLTDNGKLVPFLFILFLHVYLVTILANVGMMAVIHSTANLQTPMYYFLSYLSLVDILYTSVVTPKMLSDLISISKTISFNGCALQFFFFAALASTEALLLSNMSYDRYAAICHPLLYVSIMTKKKCLSLVFIAFTLGFLQSSVQTSCAFTLQFCRSNLIDHFYCDIPSLLKLSCSDTFSCDMVTAYIVGACGIGSLTVITVSYILIISSILRIKSTKGRQKTFSTCSSHLMCICIFFGTVLSTYLHSPFSNLKKQDKIASVLYSVVIPMLNPLIYSLRNQEVKRTVMRAIHYCTNVYI
ncbi:olfactory receptor 5AP2-like [Mixophyes fleayi]|uniref:olfactory receptor 5AP2-like n=1 Tax=Mixophyes fleayi TaxID=3061075 RepID=UPI003F4E0601